MSAENAPAFMFYADRWIGSEARHNMTVEQRGRHLDLLCYAWINGGLPGEGEKLADLVEPAAWTDALSSQWPLCPDGRRRNPGQEQYRERKNDRSRFAPPVEEPIPEVFVFPLRGQTDSWECPADKLDEWAATFVGVDMGRELVRARQWLRDNPARRKTARGMAPFLSAWLARVSGR